MVPFSPAQPDALPNLTVLFWLAQSDALPRLGLSLLLDLMIEANNFLGEASLNCLFAPKSPFHGGSCNQFRKFHRS